MDQVMEIIEKVPQQFRLVIVLGVCVLIVALYIFLLRFPTLDEMERLNRRYDEVHKKHMAKKAIADDLQNWQLEVQRLEVQLDEALNQLPNEIDTDQLLVTIPNIAKKNALVVSKFEIGQERGKGSYSEIPMALDLVGTYRGIGGFAQEIGDQPRIMAVRALDLKSSGKSVEARQTSGEEEDGTAEPEALTELKIKAEVVTYRFVPDGTADTTKRQRRGGAR